MAALPYDDSKKCKDGEVNEQESVTTTSPDQDGDTQHDSGPADNTTCEEVTVTRW